MQETIKLETPKNIFFSKRREDDAMSNATEFVIRVTRNNLFLMIRSLEGELLA